MKGVFTTRVVPDYDDLTERRNCLLGGNGLPAALLTERWACHAAQMGISWAVDRPNSSRV
jgi:hypothetical protein